MTTIGILLGSAGLYLTIVGAPAVLGAVGAYGMMFGGDTIAVIPTAVDICKTYIRRRRNMKPLRNNNNNNNHNNNNHNTNNNNNITNNNNNNNYNSIISDTSTASLSESSAMTLPNGGLRQDFDYGDIVTITVPISKLKKRNCTCPGHGVHVESSVDDCKNNYNDNTTTNNNDITLQGKIIGYEHDEWFVQYNITREMARKNNLSDDYITSTDETNLAKNKIKISKSDRSVTKICHREGSQRL